MISKIGATLFVSGLTSIITDPMLTVLGGFAFGTLIAFIFTFGMFIKDVEDAIAGGIIGWIIFAICYGSPVGALILGILGMGFAPIIDPFLNKIFRQIE